MTTTRLAFAVAFGALLGLGGGYLWWHAHAAAVPAADGEAVGAAAETPHEPGTVSLDPETVIRLGIATAALANGQAVPTLTAPGRLVADPSAAATVRAPLAGHLVAGPRPLPGLGALVAAGDPIAVLQPRLTPSERVDTAQRRAQAGGDLAAGRATATSAEQDLARLRTLHAAGNAASQRAVELAEAELSSQQARIAAAEQTLAQLPADGTSPITLTAPIAGTVVAVTANLGEDVDAGTAVLQLADTSHLLARIAVPAAADVAPTFASARLELLDSPGAALEAPFVGWVDAGTGDRALVLAVTSTADHALRPGLPLLAHLPRRGAPRAGLQVPEAAIVRRGDGAWLYLRTAVAEKALTFRRVPLQLAAPHADGWLATSADPAFTAGAEAVVTGAGALLSAERMAGADAEGG